MNELQESIHISAVEIHMTVQLGQAVPIGCTTHPSAAVYKQ